MIPTKQTVNGKDVARFASDKLHIWSDLIGCEVTHTERGSGHILSVKQRPSYIPLIYIQFGNETAVFNSDSFLSGKCFLLVDVDLARLVNESAEAMAAQERELARLDARKNEKKEQIKRDKTRVVNAFGHLARKYNVPVDLLWGKNEITPLGVILEKLGKL